MAGLLPGSSGRRRAEIGALTARKHQPPPLAHTHTHSGRGEKKRGAWENRGAREHSCEK